MKIFNKSEWKKVKLGDIFNLQMGKTPLRENKLYWNKGEYNWISISDMNFSEKYVSFTKEKITNLAVKESGIKIIPKNTVIMSFKLSIGKVKIVNDDIYSNEAIMAFIPKENFFIDKNFLYYCLKSLKWNEGINKAVKGLTLNKNLISQKEIFLPDLAIQKEIANNLDGIDNLLELRKKQLIYLKELSKSLFTSMFGDIKTNDKNWEIKKLKELVEIKSYRINENLDSIWLLNLEDIEPNTGKLIRKREISFENIPSSTISFNEDYILYSKLRPYLNKVFLPDEKGIGTSELIPLLPKKIINKIFLVEYLRNDKVVDFLSQKVSGAKMPRIIMKEFQDLNLIVPPIELQNKFAERVEKIEKLSFNFWAPLFFDISNDKREVA
ncbi:restriction endonuclease subunit S [Fusobacterium polymorphum]|uniref:Restriction endonuclease subunit S n=1 Tax=Fusobacterium nucleatum subsp. polymorphum TaxID=76857 RepID=A0A2C6BVV7_FUSNP|nr:restriction endonuclease subunit S [Fusobacterium polymorphum]PHI07985.1 restriction endonuclease subunit S [Fusobacterium polymorphum]